MHTFIKRNYYLIWIKAREIKKLSIIASYKLTHNEL